MTMKLILEAIAYSLIYSAFMLFLFQKQGARKQRYNYPPAIRERAIQKGITSQKELDETAKKNKSVGLAVMMLLCIVITSSINHQTSFGAGFWQSYFFLNSFSLTHWSSILSGSAIPNGG